jgi:hypothetical protein
VWCSLWGTDWILKYYLDELRFQRVETDLLTSVCRHSLLIKLKCFSSLSCNLFFSFLICSFIFVCILLIYCFFHLPCFHYILINLFKCLSLCEQITVLINPAFPIKTVPAYILRHWQPAASFMELRRRYDVSHFYVKCAENRITRDGWEVPKSCRMAWKFMFLFFYIIKETCCEIY